MIRWRAPASVLEKLPCPLAHDRIPSCFCGSPAAMSVSGAALSSGLDGARRRNGRGAVHAVGGILTHIEVVRFSVPKLKKAPCSSALDDGDGSNPAALDTRETPFYDISYRCLKRVIEDLDGANAMELDVRGRIVLAAINCIERSGVQAVTVRDIAREASVNVAAVNYHFGSKATLLDIALEQTLREGTSTALAELDALIARTGDLRGSTRAMLLHVFQGMVRYPRITQWHLNDALTGDDYSGRGVVALNDLLDGFLERTRPLLRSGSEAEQRTSVVQLWSAMLFVGMMPDVFAQFSGLDLRTSEAGGVYIDRLMDHFLPGSG